MLLHLFAGIQLSSKRSIFKNSVWFHKLNVTHILSNTLRADVLQVNETFCCAKIIAKYSKTKTSKGCVMLMIFVLKESTSCC